ncbi:MAG: hypothetical protein V4633_04950 [Pseudomonadota bacterium]
MNIAKNMEVIFVAAIALIGATSLATAAANDRVAVAPVAVSVDAKMPVVTVTAKRLTAAEKAASAQ